jgi:hypothetical protein
MKLSTIKLLKDVHIKDDWWKVLDIARRILSWKINDRLQAESNVHRISQAIFRDDIIKRLATSEWFTKDNMDQKARKNFILTIKLVLLKLQLFAILDRVDARTVWENIKTPQWIDKISQDPNFFYHISHWPVLLLSELLWKWFLPDGYADIFPRSCILDDFMNSLRPTDPESSTFQHVADLKEDIKQAQDEWADNEATRLQSRLKVIEANIQRYF